MVIKILLFLALITFSTQVSKSSPICDVCHFTVRAFQKQVPKYPAIPILEKIAYQYCIYKHLFQNNVCLGAIKEMTELLLTGLWRHYTNPHLICQDVFLCSKQYVKRDLNTDIKNIIKNKPDKKWQKPTDRKTLKIVHVTDIHIDLFYGEGFVVDCTQPVCCRNNSTRKGNSTTKSGYWGSLGQCDLPIQTFDLFLTQMQNIKPDAILWTGDNTPHDIWQQTQSYNLNFTFLLAQKFKQRSNATIIPSMGNHESFPVNVYDYNPKSDREWVLNSGLGQAWKFWLDEKALKMQREKGYFSMTYPQFNNLKVISINTQTGNNQNFLLLQDISDPGNNLQWIISQLQQSEQKGQMVYIIGHIPPKSILNDWSMRFNAIVDRYSYIIRGQFYGHTHSDQLSFFPNFNKMVNISTAELSNYCFVSPSLEPSSSRFPQYRVMEVDYDTLQVKDYSQFRLDIKKYTRSDQNASFELFYKFKQAYKLDDMTVQGGMTKLRDKLRDDPQTLALYLHYKNGGVKQQVIGQNAFCDTTSSPQFESQCNGNTYKKSVFERAAGPWRQWKHQD